MVQMWVGENVPITGYVKLGVYGNLFMIFFCENPVCTMLTLSQMMASHLLFIFYQGSTYPMKNSMKIILLVLF